MPTYAQLWTCRGFAMLLCKLQLERLENVARSPTHPIIPATPPLVLPSPPSPQLTKVTYSSAFQLLQCGDLGGVGWGEGGGVCRGNIGAPLNKRSEPPGASFRGSLFPSFLQLGTTFLVSALVGRSRTLPPRLHSFKFPLGIQSPRGRDTDLPVTQNLRFGKPGSSLGFSRQKGFSRIFPRFLIIF